MRFLFLITHYYPHTYGAELFAQKNAEYLVKNGHQVDVVTGRWQSQWKSQEIHNGVKIYRVNVIKIRYLQTILFILPQFLKSYNIIKKFKPDYIHAHIFPSLITSALLPLKKNKKIITIQGGDLADYSEIYGFFSFIFKPIIGMCLRKHGIIHAVSSDLKKQIKQLTQKDSIVIPNGIDIFQKYLPKKKNKNYLLFSPSRLTEKNNLEATIRAISILRTQGYPLRLEIAGTGHLHKKLTFLIKSLGLSESVKLLGYLPHSLIIKKIQQANAVIRVSIKEGFGIAQLEAMALKTPLISSNVGGLVDFVKTTTAFIPANDRPLAISNTIKNCMKFKNDKKVNYAYKLVKKNFSWDIILPKIYHEIYRII